MIGTLIAVALLAQPPTPTRADLELTMAVEDFAHATPPEPYARMIADLGAPAWASRESASNALESAVRSDPGAVRWLFSGRRDKDPEVGLRCNTIIRRLYRCPDCEARKPELRQWWSCDSCGDTNSAWPYIPWY